MVSPLLSNLVMIQNRLLGLYYTTVHTYCGDFGFPSPPPPMEEVVAIWNGAFGPIKSEIESISFIARGKSIQQPMNGAPPKPIHAAINGTRRTASGLISGSSSRALRAPLTPQETHTPAPAPAPTSSYKPPNYANATDFTTATILGGAAVNRDQPRPDYLNNNAAERSPLIRAKTSNGFLGKKKPPPPPPKRAMTTKPDEWVVALYAFNGQGGGDLSFQEGDRIKIVKKTDTDQDWYVFFFSLTLTPMWIVVRERNTANSD
jgi:amphiphysin